MITEFGKWCRYLRIDENERLADMAARIGVSSAFLSAIEHGKRNVPVKMLASIKREYSLNEAEIRKMEVAAGRSVRSIKISLESADNDLRQLTLLFFRKINSLPEQSTKAIWQILNQYEDTSLEENR